MCASISHAAHSSFHCYTFIYLLYLLLLQKTTSTSALLLPSRRVKVDLLLVAEVQKEKCVCVFGGSTTSVRFQYDDSSNPYSRRRFGSTVNQLLLFARKQVVAEEEVHQEDEHEKDQSELEDNLKKELSLYLEKRKSVNADEAAKENIGKVIGGTKGNLVLEYISGSPNKEHIITIPSNPFDYDELTKYGYGHLVTPIMKAGGRLYMYEIMNMVPPRTPKQPKSKSNDGGTASNQIIIDRDGKTDKARYSGLKLGQVYDDTIQGEALVRVQEKISAGVEIRPKLVEETYEIPFADNRKKETSKSVSKWKPDWTVEQLDEWGKKQGQVQTWVRQARLGEYISDPNEWFNLVTFQQQLYSILSIAIIVIAFGKSSPTFINEYIFHDDSSILTPLLQTTTTATTTTTTTISSLSSSSSTSTILNLFKIPASVFILTSIGSSIICSIDSISKNRNSFIWTVKGLLGGPFTVQYLQTLSDLQTRGEKQIQIQEQQQQQQMSKTKQIKK